jgi:SAM-dependent methyltransferase
MAFPASQRNMLRNTKTEEASYSARLAAEEECYRDCHCVHDLPPIHDYWADTYIRPKNEAFGFSNPDQMFAKYLAEQCSRAGSAPQRFASIGSGNCDLEAGLAAGLRSQGHTEFVIECVDLNPAMLERGRAAAAENGVSAHLEFLQADFNAWEPRREYDAVLANQSLHHVVNLEGLFGQIRRSLKRRGTFLISDMIGRNGHQRWPEALHLVREFWRILPPSYRYNRQLLRYEEMFEDWDSSNVGFEGIRAQDVLPLLLEYFHFQLFIGYGNVIDPFVDRSFGHNFDASAPWDREFIDEVHRRDEEEMASGRIKPTRLLAVVGADPSVAMQCSDSRSPAFSVRDPNLTVPAGPDLPASPYEWGAWPHDADRELKIACERLKADEDRYRQELSRTAGELEEMTRLVQHFRREWEERTEWALQLNEEVERLRALNPVERRLLRLMRAARRLARG